MVARSLIDASSASGTPELEGAKSGSAGWVAAALETALRARAPSIHASTPLVARLAHRVGCELGFDARSQTLLEVSVRVRDIGMMSLPDSVLLARELLTPEDWELVHRHPILGAELLESLSPVAEAAPIVRAHHERWDGEGYPEGLGGDAIPALSRVIATCDAFVAMATDRPYRRGVGADAALERIRLERGAQLDPRIADAFAAVVARTSAPHNAVRGTNTIGAVVRPRARGRVRAPGRPDLASALADFDVVPAFAPACEHALAASDGGTATGELVAAIEGDTGLTVAVLRKAQAVASRSPIANVADAVAALSPIEIQEVITALPRTQFPWRTTPLEVLMHHSRIHAQSVTRAADRIAIEVGVAQRDDLLAAALLHDIGKLVLNRAGPEDMDAADIRSISPEGRVRNEQRALGIDHASLGGALLDRWGLPTRLASAVAAHHTSDAENAVATCVRLADMIVHHSRGDAVDRTIMLRVAHACDLSPGALRDVMFDLPHSHGSRRHRAERSPLSIRETDVLRLLAQGKSCALIAAELDVATSTVRSHLHKSYVKLGVADRAQAVLRATAVGWI
ncbi:MAG: HD domain-containing phosphohydrolase [Solirubrobacteraceae bacterium]